MKLKMNYFVIPLVAVISGIAGSYYTRTNMSWYANINLPWYTPPRYVFPVVWNIIYVLTIIAALIVWNQFERTIRFWTIMILFALNAVLNAAWSYIFFTRHLIGWAFIDALLIELTVLALIWLISQSHKKTAYLLVPYAVWVAFAILLNAHIWLINMTV